LEGDLDLAAAVDLSFVGSYRKLTEHVIGGAFRRFGAVDAFTTDAPSGLFNGCLVVRRARVADLNAALDWLGGLDVPHRVFLRQETAGELVDVPLARGFERDVGFYPGMAMNPVPEPPTGAGGVVVRPVEDRQGMEEFLRVVSEDSVPSEPIRRLFPESLAADPDVRLFTAFLDGRPVGTSLAIRSGSAAGVYAVGTHPAARRRGVGTAATWAAVGAGRAWGCEAIVLQSTEMGLSLYEAMGFRTVVRYLSFRRVNEG
jgi:GNAT superfamily N-acetyltransferase